MPLNRPLAVCAAALATCSTGLLLAHEGHGVNTDPGPDGAGGAFEASNVVLIKRIGLTEFDGSNPGSGADCWGYTSPSGREYAIMTTESTAAFVEITDPVNPVVVEIIPHAPNLWADVKVINDHAYICTERENGSIQIVDLTGIDSGVVSLVGSITDINITRAHNVIVDNLGERLYLCGGRNGGTSIANGGLLAFDVSNPADPQHLGTYGATYVHDAQVHVFESGPNAGKTVAFCFVAGNGVDIVDFTNGAAPFRMSRTSYPGISYSHQGWFDPATNMLYQNDEVDELDGNVSTTTTRVFDCTNLSSPQLVSTFTTGLPAIDHNLYIKDGFLFEANYRSGLRIFDSNANMMSPPEVGYIDTYPANDVPDFSGAWSNYPYFDSGVVIISDINRGLFIVDPTYAMNGGVPFEYEFPTPLPESIPESGMSYSFKVNNTNGAVDPENVWFSYANITDLEAGPAPRHSGHPHTLLKANPIGGDFYEVDIPAGDCGDTLEFFFASYTLEGLSVISPFSSPIVGQPEVAFTAVYASAFDIAIEDDFESDQSWSTSTPGDDANTGEWERVDPIGTFASSGQAAQPENDNTPGDGTMCYITGQQPAGDTSLGANDVDGGITTLTSPLIDATSGGDPVLSYSLWYSNDTGSDPDDIFVVEISNNDGADWVEVETLTASTDNWESREFMLASIITPTDMMRVRFIAADTGSPSLVEAGVDDFSIESIMCTPQQTADINGDGIVDTADLGILISAFGTSDPSADINSDGTVDTADLGILIGAFGSSI